MKLFQNLFGPKWKNKNPEIRKNALIDLSVDENQATFLTVIESDDTSDIRLLALRRISDLAQIITIAAKNSDQKTCALANKLVHQTLAGISDSAHITAISQQQRIDFISSINDQKCLEYVAQNGNSSEIRAIAIARVNREAFLGDLIINEADRNIRLSIAESLTQKPTLERVLKAVKNKDKQLRKVIQIKLDEINKEIERPKIILAKQKSLCINMEQLGKKGLWEREKIQFDLLQTQWTELAAESSLELEQRFTQASLHFSKSYDSYLERNAERLKQAASLLPTKEQKQKIISQLSQLLLDLKNDGTSDFNEITKKQSKLNSDWKQTEKLPTEIEVEFERQYTLVNRDIRQNITNFQNSQKTNASLTSLQAEIKSLLKQPSRLTDAKLARIDAKLNAIQSSDNVITQQISNIKDLVLKAKTVLSDLATKSNKIVKDTKTLIQDLQSSIDGGEIKSANETQKTIQANIKQLERLNHKQINDLKSQSAECTNKLFELNKWRSWANTPQKLRLVEEMEALVETDIDPKEIAFMVSNARKQWQKLGPSEKESSQELWERFKKACDAAYEPCKKIFADESKIRSENQQSRISFLDNFEKFVHQENWNDVNWGKVENLFQQSRNEWNNLGAVDKSKRKQLNNRFNKAHSQLKSHLQKEWDSNLVVKKEIVEKALAAVENEDLNDAINTAKKLQQQWKTTGRIQRHQETDLWANFRGSCDKIFARRENLKVQKQSEEAEVESSKNNLCEKLEILCNGSAIQVSSKRNEIMELKKQIQALPASNSKLDNAIKARIETALEILKTKKKAESRIEQINLLQKLKLKIDFVQEIEKTLEKEESVNWEATAQQFNLLEPLNDDNWNSLVDKRYNTLKGEPKWSGLVENANENLKSIQSATIQLEIIAEIETPAESSIDRLKIQTERLNNKMNNHQDENQWESFIQTETNWLLSGTLPADDLKEFKNRHTAIIDALKEQYAEELENY